MHIIQINDEKRFATNVNNLFSYIAIAFGTRFHRLLSVIVVPRFSIPSNISIVLNTDLVRRFRGTFSFKFIILLFIGVSFIACCMHNLIFYVLPTF